MKDLTINHMVVIALLLGGTYEVAGLSRFNPSSAENEIIHKLDSRLSELDGEIEVLDMKMADLQEYNLQQEARLQKVESITMAEFAR